MLSLENFCVGQFLHNPFSKSFLYLNTLVSFLSPPLILPTLNFLFFFFLDKLSYSSDWSCTHYGVENDLEFLSPPSRTGISGMYLHTQLHSAGVIPRASCLLDEHFTRQGTTLIALEHYVNANSLGNCISSVWIYDCKNLTEIPWELSESESFVKGVAQRKY